MDRIVVPLDESALSERALPIAREIARHTGAQVRLVEAVPPDELERASDYLDRLADLMNGVDIATEATSSSAGVRVADTLLAALERPGDSLLCMSSHGRSGLGAAVLGSTAEDVLRRTDRPVLVVGRECALPWPGHHRTLLVPVEGWEQDELILRQVVEIVEQSDLQPVLLQVVHPMDVGEGTRAGEALEHAREQLHSLGVDAKTDHRFASNVPLTIDEAARTWGAALIVMALYVPSGAPRTLLGSVTMSTVRHAPCPVLVYPGRSLGVSTS
jgi:nucleotide-binding universal stress UspA family protein